MSQGLHLVEEQDGKHYTAPSYVLRHIPTHFWEDLGVYPEDEHHKEDGVRVSEVQLGTPPAYYTLCITTNSDSTVNVELSHESNDQYLLFAQYLVDANELHAVLHSLKERFSN